MSNWFSGRISSIATYHWNVVSQHEINNLGPCPRHLAHVMALSIGHGFYAAVVGFNVVTIWGRGDWFFVPQKSHSRSAPHQLPLLIWVGESTPTVLRTVYTTGRPPRAAARPQQSGSLLNVNGILGSCLQL